MNNFHELLRKLDEDQKKAVHAPVGPVAILAGAGTGKTSTLTARIARMVVDFGINSQNILAVTFTTKAARELQERIQSTIHRSMSAHTFHSAAFRQLKYLLPLINEDTSWKILTGKSILIQRIVSDNRSWQNLSVPQLQKDIEKAKCSGLTPEKVATLTSDNNFRFTHHIDLLAEIYCAYEHTKNKENVYDFDDLLIKLISLFDNHEHLCELVQSRYSSFFVDEFQDLNHIQHQLLKKWVGSRENVTVVGDVNQTIYSFAGASANHLLHFPQWYPHAHIIYLSRDYRSTQPITELANTVIGHSTLQHKFTKIRLQGQRTETLAPTIIRYSDEEQETAAIVTQCKKLIEQGISPQEIAILYRINSQSTLFEEALFKASIPYRVKDGSSIINHKISKTVFARIESTVNQLDRVNKKFTIEDLDTILRFFGYKPASYRAGERDKRNTILVKLRELLYDFIASPSFDHKQFLLYLREQSTHAGDEDSCAVTLSTIHAAKGLEWWAVFLPRMVEKNTFGNNTLSSVQLTEMIEEERRLFYVGITRAKVYLAISWAQHRFEQSRKQQPSQFLTHL